MAFAHHQLCMSASTCAGQDHSTHHTLTRAGLRLFAPKKLLFEIGQLENLHATEGVHFQQENITGDQNLGLCRNGQLQKWIVLGVSALCDRGGRLYKNHGLAEKAQPDQAMFKRSPGIELFIRQYQGQLIECGCRKSSRSDGALGFSRSAVDQAL